MHHVSFKFNQSLTRAEKEKALLKPWWSLNAFSEPRPGTTLELEEASLGSASSNILPAGGSKKMFSDIDCLPLCHLSATLVTYNQPEASMHLSEFIRLQHSGTC